MDKLVVGCGYLGLRVARRWQADGHTVWATTRDPARQRELAALGFRPVRCDVLDPAGLAALPDVDTVVWCVGLDRRSGRSMREVYVTGLSHLLTRWRERPPGKLIYVSSTSVYGQTDGDWVDETAATEPRTDSGRVMLDAEQAVRASWLPSVVLRFAGIYGPGRLLRRVEALTHGEPFQGDPERWLNLIQVDDGAAAVLAADKGAEPGTVYNVCDDQPVPRRDFFIRLAELVQAPAPRWVEPDGDALGDPAQRRICNRRLIEQLQLKLQYPSCREGLAAALGGTQA